MRNEQIIRSLAGDFILNEFDEDHTYLGSEGHKSFIEKLKTELSRLYEPESKIYFLNEISKQVFEYQSLHNQKCQKGENCDTYKEYQKALFFIEQEVNSLPQIIEKKNSNNLERKKVFISYSHVDKKWLIDLKRHFKPINDKVDFWDDSNILPGQKWKDAITKAVNSAKVAILLISADFFNSRFIEENELPPLLNAADKDGAIILNVFLKPSLVEEYPEVLQYQGINSPTNTIIQMDEANKELIWMELVKQVKRILIE